MKNEPTPNYLAYLVRLWRENETNWRGTLENPHTGQRYAFASIEELLSFLKQQTSDHNDEL